MPGSTEREARGDGGDTGVAQTDSCGSLNDRTLVASDSIPQIESRTKETFIVVVSLVAKFLAGSNSYGTLANLSRASKLVRSEITPILYETVILDGDRGWWREKRSAGEREWFESSSLRENLRYTKYAVMELFTHLSAFGHSLFSESILLVTKYMSPPAGPTRSSNEDTEDTATPNYCSNLFVYKSVHARTLADILAVPLRWVLDGRHVKEAVIAVREVWVNHDAYMEGNPDFRRLLQSTSPCAEIVFTFEHGRDARALTPRALTNTMRGLFAMIDPTESICTAGCGSLPIEERNEKGAIREGKHVRHLTINMPDGTMELLKLCLHALVPILTSGHRVNVRYQVQLNEPGPSKRSRAELEHVRKAARVFFYNHDNEFEFWRNFRTSGAALTGRNTFFEFVFLGMQQLGQAGSTTTNLSLCFLEHGSPPPKPSVNHLERFLASILVLLEGMLSALEYVASTRLVTWIASTRLCQPVVWPNNAQDAATIGAFESWIARDSPSIAHYIVVAILRYLLHRLVVLLLVDQNATPTVEHPHYLGAIYVCVVTRCCAMYRP